MEIGDRVSWRGLDKRHHGTIERGPDDNGYYVVRLDGGSQVLVHEASLKTEPSQ